METHRRGAAGSRTTTPSRPTRRSAIDHPTSTGAPSSWETLSASPNCLTNRGTEQPSERGSSGGSGTAPKALKHIAATVATGQLTIPLTDYST